MSLYRRELAGSDCLAQTTNFCAVLWNCVLNGLPCIQHRQRRACGKCIPDAANQKQTGNHGFSHKLFNPRAVTLPALG